MADQIIDPAMARKPSRRRLPGAPAGWVARDEKTHPRIQIKFASGLVTDLPSLYLLVADVLAEILAVLPPNLVRTDRQPVGPKVIENLVRGHVTRLAVFPAQIGIGDSNPNNSLSHMIGKKIN